VLSGLCAYALCTNYRKVAVYFLHCLLLLRLVIIAAASNNCNTAVKRMLYCLLFQLIFSRISRMLRGVT